MTMSRLLRSPMRFLITFSMFFGLLGLLGMSVFASKVVFAQAPMMTIPQFMPVGSWNVEQTFLSKAKSLKGIQLPCMMANSYDNGYILRLSGGGGIFLAMAIDFKQNVFKQGRKYDSVVSLNNGYTNKVKATAFSKSVLIFNVRSFAGFYQALQGANSMIIDVEGNPLQFSFGDFAAAMQRLEACFGGAMLNAVPMGAPTPVGINTLPEPPAPEAKSAKFSTSVAPKWNDRVSPRQPVMAPSSSQSFGTSGASQMLWEAKAGDDMRRTLEGWANRAGVSIDWQASPSGRVASDIRISGSFENAVQNLMAQNAAAMGLEANMMGIPPSAGAYYGGAPQRIIPASVSSMPPVAPPLGGGIGKWNAPAGSNLQQVLDVWSRQAGVEFIWESNQGFVVKAPVTSNGSYEEALQSLLSQFSNDSVRPAVQLNNDPVSGRRILLVQSTRI